MTRKKGLTLLEIIVASVILVIVLAGMANLFIAGKRWIMHSRLRATGGELGKYFIDPLHMLVRQDTWNTTANCLSIKNCPNGTAGAAQGLDKNYTANYTITNLTAVGWPSYNSMMRVVANISWDEPAP